MEWVLRSPQIHSTFGSLGYVQADGYHVNENCNDALETILHNILSEDKYLRSYRRSISFGQNIKKDLIPLLIHVKEEKTIELLTRVLVNLTIPIECLLSTDVISKTDFGRHTIFEINNLLTSAKAAFTDHRTTRVIIDFLKKNLDVDQKSKLSLEQCTNISNSLLLLRNILHIPEENAGQSPNYNGPTHTVQNQILWNIFSQGIDKVLIKLMIIPDATNWGVTMVQLIALLYKDQHVVTLHKLLNLWLEASLSESSEDNESNTSPPDRRSDDSSPMLTSDPTSDSSDTGGSGKSNDTNMKSVCNDWNSKSVNSSTGKTTELFMPPLAPIEKVSNTDEKKKYTKISRQSIEHSKDDSSTSTIGGNSDKSDLRRGHLLEKKSLISENSDCGYGTQIENQESISTSSNDDELPDKKPVHQKPHNAKSRMNNKARTATITQDRKRKKLIKRGKSNIINVQGLLHKTPTDDDISNVLKEFTVDFLLKGYNSLVQTLHNQILTNLQLEIDTSHFFWLLTYFLKFATQIELDVEHVCSVLSFDIVSYLTAEGVNLCEQFELAMKLDGNDLKPSIRRLHLVVTAIRELVQAIEMYKKFTHIRKDDQDVLVQLQVKMCETEELRSLLVLLLRHYDPKYHSKQYLQDIVVTNHILLMFLDNIMKLPEYSGSTNMQDHLKQFASPEIMYQCGLLLEDYAVNGEFVNDCIFTLMHHVGGELDSLITLFQPKILKTFTSIWKSEFEICDDWSDLIEYVINTFIKKPHKLQTTANFRLDTENFDDDNVFAKPIGAVGNNTESNGHKVKLTDCTSNSSKDRWTDDEVSSLSWNYIQCSSMPDAIGELIKMFKEDGIVKTRDSIIRELFKQNLIDKEKFEILVEGENERLCQTIVNSESRDDEISKLCKQLAQDGKSKCLDWVQKVLLDTCYAKIYIVKKPKTFRSGSLCRNEYQMRKIEKSHEDLPVISPVSYHSLLRHSSVPLVPWNCEQASTCKDLKFLQLLHKLGFYMPVDSGKVFIRIPHFWTAEFLYEVAGKILPIDKSRLKFFINDIADSSMQTPHQSNFIISKDIVKDVTMIEPSENFYQVHKQKHHVTMVNFTPMPGTSFSSECQEDNKPNWFDLVQKSRELKLNMERRRPEETAKESPPGEQTAAPPAHVLHSLLMPTLPTIVPVKNEAPNFIHVEDEFYNYSVCETASVACDLTRMYVSDKSEKSET